MTGGNSNCNIHFVVKPFFDEWSRIKKRSKDAAQYYVRFQAKKLVRVLAFSTPIAEERDANRGRARAGWWPAALAMGVTSVYTPIANRGEGSAVDASTDPLNPSVTITNGVPYISIMTRHGLAWADNAVNQVRAEIMEYLERAWQRVLTG